LIATISPTGATRCLYTEMIDLGAIGKPDIVRASNVEPDATGQWFAHIINGPILGPYPNRSNALRAEIEYIETYILSGEINHAK
jgi:hypothetical protein